ncbi:MAG: amidohydrolase family protein [Acidimicrobiia bacterium]
MVINEGLIAAIDAAGSSRETPDATDHDLDGFLLLPAAADPHAHLDKALSADSVPNPTRDLSGAIDAWERHYPRLSVDEIADRARLAALSGLARGYSSIRTHIDVAEAVGLKPVHALLRVRAELIDLVEIQICGLVAVPTTGVAGAGNRDTLRQALEMGLDVVGGAVWRDPDPVAGLEFLLGEAASFGLPIDLHLDETLEPTVLVLADFARLVRATGFRFGATASHCVSLGVQTVGVQETVAGEVAAAGISVVANPFTNLYLQARDHPVAPPRGLTALRPLLAAGANLAAGTDNVEDPFNIMGRPDPLEVASLLVIAGHLSPEEAYWAVSGGARRAMGLPPVAITVGSAADLLAVRAESLRQALATGSPERLVFRRGELVARTTVSEWIATGRGSGTDR